MESEERWAWKGRLDSLPGTGVDDLLVTGDEKVLPVFCLRLGG